jgi:hypothetical protein
LKENKNELLYERQYASGLGLERLEEEEEEEEEE